MTIIKKFHVIIKNKNGVVIADLRVYVRATHFIILRNSHPRCIKILFKNIYWPSNNHSKNLSLFLNTQYPGAKIDIIEFGLNLILPKDTYYELGFFKGMLAFTFFFLRSRFYLFDLDILSPYLIIIILLLFLTLCL